MKVLMRLFALILIFGVNLPACHSDDSGSTTKRNKTADKGANHAMKTYCMGRFALDVPAEMKQAVQAQTFRLIEIKEIPWKADINVSSECNDKWQEHLLTLESLKKPQKVKNIVIKEEQLSGVGRWARAVLYYGDYMANDEGNWDIFVDYGDHYVLFKLAGMLDAQVKMLSWMKEVVCAYNPKPIESKIDNAFYTQRGEIALPYKRQEKTYSRFEGHPLDLKLEVEMSETHKVEKLGLAERLAASIATRFAPGVDVDRIRSRSRIAAGLKGEELVMRMSASDEDTQIQFAWEHRGEAESGERPEIQITMEAPDGSLNEKLKVWDAILDSFKPMYR